jgi:MATE family multidrug resistance protein
LFKSIKELAVFALPIIFGQIGIMMIATGDMIIAGRHSTDTLAAIGLAVALINPVLVGGLGFQFCVSALLSQKRGEGEEIDHYLRATLIYTLIISIPIVFLSMATIYILPLFNFEPHLVPIIKD